MKILVKVSGNEFEHEETFEQLLAYFSEKYQLVLDSKCKDVNRLCFLSNDPDIWINEAAQVFEGIYSIVEPTKSSKIRDSVTQCVADIEMTVNQIESLQIDITDTYNDWLTIGFALADELAEKGRSYFHRLSRFHKDYQKTKTDKQYTYCLNNNKHGITINSFFFIAKKKIENKDINFLSENVKASNKNIIFYSPVFDRNQNIVDVKINYTKLNELLFSFGFQRFDVENDFIMVKIQKNIIEEVKANSIQDTFFMYLESLPPILENGISRDILIEKFNKSPETYFSKKRYSLLRPTKEYVFVCDTKEKCYIFYNNGFVECTAEGWQLKDYDDLNGFIWKNQIHDRDFELFEIKANRINELGDFAKFVYNIANKDEERFKSLCTLMGYNLHTYFEGKRKATILTDSRISDLPDGRTGKSLLSTGLGKIKKTCNIKGKDFDPGDKFKYQEADLDDQIVTIDDARKNLDFEMMFNDITEGIKVNKKNLKPFTIQAKILITTNRTIKIEGVSAKDRSIEFELADHYNENFSPQNEFNKWFFGSDFSKGDWSEFDNFMTYCISLYLKNGVLRVSSINLNRRKLLEMTNNDFVEFMDAKVSCGQIKQGQEYLKQELHTLFLTEYPEYRNDKFLSKLRTFTLYLRLYAKYSIGFAEVRKEDERKSGDKRYILFRNSIEG